MFTPKYFYKPKNTDPNREKALMDWLDRARTANIAYKSPENEVFFDGDINSPIMFIGEAPGQDEVIQKKPFVGRSGQLMQQMLDAAGISRDKMYITNTVLWRPPDNRTPLPEEISIMRPYLLEHIKIIQPKIIVCIGGVAYRCLTQNSLAISKIRGQWAQHKLCDKVMTIFHPSYLLRSPVHKRETWNDILRIREEGIKVGSIVDKGLLID